MLAVVEPIEEEQKGEGGEGVREGRGGGSKGKSEEIEVWQRRWGTCGLQM